MKIFYVCLFAAFSVIVVSAQNPSAPKEQECENAAVDNPQSTPEKTFALYQKLSLRHRGAVITKIVHPEGREQEAYVFCRIPLGGDRDRAEAFDMLKMCYIENEWVIIGVTEADRVLLARITDEKISALDTNSGDLSEDGKMLAALEAMQKDLNERVDGIDTEKDLKIIEKKIALCKDFIAKFEPTHLDSSILRRIRKMQSRHEELLKIYVENKNTPDKEAGPDVKVSPAPAQHD